MTLAKYSTASALLLLFILSRCTSDVPQECKLPPVSGGCGRPLYFYDPEAGECKEMNRTLCPAKGNGYERLVNCQEKCGASHDVCKLPPVIGRCKALIPSFYYDPDVKKCFQFEYSGCQGNGNRFPTEDLCMKACDKEQLIE